eukprot:4730957-Pleurochrysis_carterae.AAC.1
MARAAPLRCDLPDAEFVNQGWERTRDAYRAQSGHDLRRTRAALQFVKASQGAVDLVRVAHAAAWQRDLTAFILDLRDRSSSSPSP